MIDFVAGSRVFGRSSASAEYAWRVVCVRGCESMRHFHHNLSSGIAAAYWYVTVVVAMLTATESIAHILVHAKILRFGSRPGRGRAYSAVKRRLSR